MVCCKVVDVNNRHYYRVPIGLLIRFILYFSASAAGVLAAIIWLEYHKFVLERAQSNVHESLRLSLTMRAMHINLRESIRDVRTLAALQVTQDYARRGNTRNRARLEKEFVNFSRINRHFTRLRFLDAAGRELVQVKFDGQNAVAVPLGEIQGNAQRFYLRKEHALSKDTIYISPLGLSVEAEQFERPLQPVIHFEAPLLDGSGRLQGVLVLTYLADTLLNNFWEFMVDSRGDPMIVNAKGHWLANSNRNLEWGFLLGSNETFGGHFAKAWEHIAAEEFGQVRTAEGLFIFKTVRPYAVMGISGGANGQQYRDEDHWKLISRIAPGALVFSPVSVFETWPREIMALWLLVGVLSAALAWMHTNNMSKTTALRERESQLAEAQRLAHLGNWVWHIPDGTLVWSDEIYRIFGLDPHNSVASYNDFLKIIHPADRDKVHDAVAAALEDDTPYAIDHRIVLPNEDIRYVRERGAVQFDNNGRPLRMLGTVYDITEVTEAAQALRASEARYRNLFENMVDGYALQEILFDEKGKPYDFRYLEINPAFERILGLSREQVIGKTVLQVFPDTESYWMDIFTDAALNGSSRRLEQYGKSFDRYFEVTASSPGQGLVAVLFADVTERKQAEQQLQKYREHLEQQVAHRTAELEASNRELEAFSYSIAHDLRTPLRTITSFSQILLEEAFSNLSDQQREDLQRIVNAGKHMSNLIDDILELARISRAEFTIATVNLSNLAETIIDNLRQLEPQRTVQVDVSANLYCRGDLGLLNIAMENLLSNAWKYTGNRVDATIAVGMETTGSGEVYYVRDNGIGFDMQYIDKLFRPFARLHSAEQFKGTGIGLVSAQSAIQRHGGKVWAESEPGVGTTFYFSLAAVNR